MKDLLMLQKEIVKTSSERAHGVASSVEFASVQI